MHVNLNKLINIYITNNIYINIYRNKSRLHSGADLQKPIQ